MLAHETQDPPTPILNKSMDLPSFYEIQQMTHMVEAGSPEGLVYVQQLFSNIKNINIFIYIVRQTKSDVLKVIVYSYLKKFLKENILEIDDAIEFNQWINQRIIETNEDQVIEVQAGLATLAAYFYKYQLDFDDCYKFIESLEQNIKKLSNPFSRVIILKIVLEIIQFLKDPSAHEKHSINKIMNKFIYIAVTAYSQIVLPTDDEQNPFIIGYSDYAVGIADEISYHSLKIIQECLCFDYINSKKETQETSEIIQSIFISSFSPISIPVKGLHKKDTLYNLEIIRANNIIDQFYFLYRSVSWTALKVLIVQVIGDLMRISPRFFITSARDYGRFVDKSNGFMKFLQTFSSQNLHLMSSEDIPVIIAFGQTLKKSLSVFQINRLHMQTLKHIVTNVTQVIYQEMLSRKLISLKIMTPYFDYFNKIQQYNNFPSHNAKNIIMTSIRCLKSRLINSLMDFIDFKKNGGQYTQQQKQTINMFPLIKNEMQIDPLDNPEVMQQYLALFKHLPTQMMQEQASNINIQIFYNYIRFQLCFQNYNLVKTQPQMKESYLEQMMQLIISTVTKIQNSNEQTSNYEIKNRLRLLLHHILQMFLTTPNVTTLDLPFNNILQQIIHTHPYDYKMILSLLFIVKYKNLQYLKIKSNLVNSLLMSYQYKKSQQYFQIFKLNVILCQNDELFKLLQFQGDNSYLKCIACYQVIEMTKQFQKYKIITLWFFNKIYPFITKQLEQKSETIYEFTTFIIQIFKYLLKINNINIEQKLNQNELFSLIVPIFFKLILNFPSNIEIENSHRLYLKELLLLTNSIIKMGYNESSLLKLQSYQQILNNIPNIIMMIDQNIELLDNECKNTCLIEFIKTYLILQEKSKRLSDNNNIKNILIKCIPQSFDLIDDYFNQFMIQNLSKYFFLKKLIKQTLSTLDSQARLVYMDWKHLMRILNSHKSLTTQLCQEEPLYQKYFYSVNNFEYIHITNQIKIQAQRQSMRNIHYELSETGTY